MIRTIIIDDEASAVNVLRLLLKKKYRDEVEIVATSSDPLHAKELIELYSPDLVFMDIEMPGMTGIDVVRSLNKPNFYLVFVTAYDAYAVEAFELSAVDYLLKPLGLEKVERVIEKVKANGKHKEGQLQTQLEKLEKLLSSQTDGTEQKIAIATLEKIIFVNVSDIIFCEANGAYSVVYMKDGKKLTASKSLGDFENQLNRYNFFRIHHSILVNLNKIKEFLRNDGGMVVMENGQKLEVSQRRRKDFLMAINDLIV